MGCEPACGVQEGLDLVGRGNLFFPLWHSRLFDAGHGILSRTAVPFAPAAKDGRQAMQLLQNHCALDFAEPSLFPVLNLLQFQVIEAISSEVREDLVF